MTLNEIKALAALVKNETGVDKNTASRVGIVLQEIINYFEENAGGGQEPGQPGTSFVAAPITTTAALDAHLTHSVCTVALAAPYLDWNTYYFSLLTMPYSHGVYHHMQVAFVFATATDDSFSIKARWKSTAHGDWTAWKTLAGGGGTVDLATVANILKLVPHDMLTQEVKPSHELYIIGVDEVPEGEPGVAIPTGWRLSVGQFTTYLIQKFQNAFAAISHTHAYSTLAGLPSLFSGNYNDLYNKPSIPAAQVPADWNATEGVSRILNKPDIQARLRSEVLIQWLVNAQWPQGPIGAQPGDYWIRHIYDTLKRKNGYTNEFEDVDWYNDTIYRIGNNRYLHNGSYLVLISEVYQYVPPVPSETITLAANGTYTITSATPANILIRATGAGASIAYGTLAANKAVTIAIAPDSEPIALAGNNYEGGITLFVVYTNATSTWTVNTIVDPKVDDVSDITFRAVLPTTIDVVVESGDIFVAYVVDPTGHGSSNVNPALQQGDIILYRGMDNAAANTTAYSVVTNNGDHIFLRLIATATQLRILRIQGDGVYHNQWDGVNASSIAFIKMGIAPNSITPQKLSPEVLNLIYAGL